MQINATLLLQLRGIELAIKDVLDDIQAELALEPPGASVDFTDADRLALLKLGTLLVWHLRLNVACYPLTEGAVVYYDSNGVPLPLDCLTP